GLQAREPGHLARAAEVLLGGSIGSTAPPARLLLSPGPFAAAEPEVADAARGAAGELAGRLGATGSETELLDEAPAPSEAMEAFNVLQGFQVWRNYGEWVERSSPSLGPDIAARLERASGFGEADVASAKPVAKALAGAVGRLGPTQALVLPTTGTPA